MFATLGALVGDAARENRDSFAHALVYTYSMNAEQILKAVERYKAILARRGVPAERQNTASGVKPTETEKLAHIGWMCEAIPVQVLEGSIQKAERWLCFVQGILWGEGLATIDSMRDDNR